MTWQDGGLMLLAVGNGGSPETFATIGSMRLARLSLANHILDAAHLESGAWRLLRAGTAARALSVTGNGAFADSAAEHTLRGYAFAGSVNNYRFTLPDGDTVTGPFVVSAYERAGEAGEEETFTLTLESAGAVVYVAN